MQPYQQKLLHIIAAEPGIRTKELMDRLECDIDEIDDALAPHLASHTITSHPVLSPKGLKATGYKMKEE